MRSLTLQNVGPINEAKIEFGDLTVLVGPQATGKSIALQFLKLLMDKTAVHEQMTRYGIDWAGEPTEFLEAYFGEGMGKIWVDGITQVEYDGKPVIPKVLAKRSGKEAIDHVFMIPAQRVLAMRNGWPRTFGDYLPGDPFAVRDYSEKLRLLVEGRFGESLFPTKGRLKNEIRKLLSQHVFGGFSLKVDRIASQKRLILQRDNEGSRLPQMVWSAGQREFVPLLLGLYWLMPPTRTPTRENIKWVILEELEMGLHPRAISVMILIVLELMHRGYKVCLSSHSPQVLEAVWAIRNLRESAASPELVLKMFDCRSGSKGMKEVAATAMKKELRVFYFDRKTHMCHDISKLDPGDEHDPAGRWGGLDEFSARANEVVAEAAAIRSRRR